MVGTAEKITEEEMYSQNYDMAHGHCSPMDQKLGQVNDVRSLRTEDRKKLEAFDLWIWKWKISVGLNENRIKMLLT